MNSELRTQRATSQIEWTEVNGFDDSEFCYDFEKEEKLNRLEHILTQVSVKCQQIFQLFYFEKQSMDEIARKLKYSSTNSAKTQKYKCIEKAILLSKKSENRLDPAIQPN